MAQKAGTNMARTVKGKFRGTSGLTEQQEAFVTSYLSNGNNATGAARSAGYAFPEVDGYRIIRNPRIVASIRNRRLSVVQTVGAGLALETLQEIMLDVESPPNARIKSAQIILDAAGYIGNARESRDLDDRSLSEYSMDELQSIIADGLEKRDDDARTVDVTPDNPTDTDT